MTIRPLVLVFSLLFLSISGFSQATIEDIVDEGIALHDQGDYEQAIATYKKALEIDPQSALANYEIALSYFNKGGYDEAITYADVVINQNQDHLIGAYMIKGSALDMVGKTDESIKLFKKAIKDSDGHYLLYFNLGVNYFKMGNYEDAEANLIKAIGMNSGHGSSHLMLATIHHQQGNKVQTLLATYYFLFLEPDSQRSPSAYAMLEESFGANVTKDPDKPNTINISVSPDDSPLSPAEMMVSLLEASKTTEENKDKTDDELFIENTESFFKIMGELKKNKYKEIWWTFYTPFFYELAKSEHLTAFCKYITQSSNENSQVWLESNESKLAAFGEWLKTYDEQ